MGGECQRRGRHRGPAGLICWQPCGWGQARTRPLSFPARGDTCPGLRVRRWLRAVSRRLPSVALRPLPEPSVRSALRSRRSPGAGGAGRSGQDAPPRGGQPGFQVSHGSPLPVGFGFRAERDEADGQRCQRARVGRKRSGRRGRPRGEKPGDRHPAETHSLMVTSISRSLPTAPLPAARLLRAWLAFAVNAGNFGSASSVTSHPCT